MSILDQYVEKSLKIFQNTKYIFLEVAGVIIYLWRCTAEKASLYLTCVKKYHYPPIYKYVILEEEACAVAADVGIVCQVLTSIFFPQCLGCGECRAVMQVTLSESTDREKAKTYHSALFGEF